MIHCYFYSANSQTGPHPMSLRALAITVPAFVLGACVQVGQIQQTTPIRTMSFAGPHKDVAQCVRQRLGGRVQDEGFGEKYVIYDAVKGRQSEGLTHWAVTVGRSVAAPDRGFAELRVMRPQRGPGPATVAPPPLTAAVVQEYWDPVRQCANMGLPVAK
jgi:hypothetical protein